MIPPPPCSNLSPPLLPYPAPLLPHPHPPDLGRSGAGRPRLPRLGALRRRPRPYPPPGPAQRRLRSVASGGAMPTPRHLPPRRGLLRRAMHTDLPRLFEIWTAVDEHRLRDDRDGFLATAERFMTRGRPWVWADVHDVQGFGVVDPASAHIEARFVPPDAPGSGIGRALLRND